METADLPKRQTRRPFQSHCGSIRASKFRPRRRATAESVDLLEKTSVRRASNRSGSRLGNECSYSLQSQNPCIDLSQYHASVCGNLIAICIGYKSYIL